MTHQSPRPDSIEPETAASQVTGQMGMVPNLFQGLANSPRALEAYLAPDRLISDGTLTPVEQQVMRRVVIARKTCSKFFNPVHDTVLDFPAASELDGG